MLQIKNQNRRGTDIIRKNMFSLKQEKHLCVNRLYWRMKATSLLEFLWPPKG